MTLHEQYMNSYRLGAEPDTQTHEQTLHVDIMRDSRKVDELPPFKILNGQSPLMHKPSMVVSTRAAMDDVF